MLEFFAYDWRQKPQVEEDARIIFFKTMSQASFDEKCRTVVTKKSNVLRLEEIWIFCRSSFTLLDITLDLGSLSSHRLVRAKADDLSFQTHQTRA